MASLAAVLVMVAWNMSELGRFRQLLLGPPGDRVVLLVTFALTVAVDLTVAIEVGVVLAAILFMHRMSEVVAIAGSGPAANLFEEDQDDFTRPVADVYSQRDELPKGVEVFRLRGPLFFGVAGRLSDVIDAIGRSPRVFILRLGAVPLIDASAASRLRDFTERAGRQGTQVIFSGLRGQPEQVLTQMRVLDGAAHLHRVRDFNAALDLARRLVERS
jgi:SulP family sulfate permease